MRCMKWAIVMVAIVVGGFTTVDVAQADLGPISALYRLFSWPDTVTMKFLFKQGDVPIETPVTFAVRCYARTYPHWLSDFKRLKQDEPKETYTFSGTCSEYGCEFTDQPYQYGFFDYCNLEGEWRGQPFRVDKYGIAPYTSCDEWLFWRRCVIRVSIP